MMTPFESAVRGSLEESRGGRTHVHYRNDLGDRATPLSGTQLRWVNLICACLALTALALAGFTLFDLCAGIGPISVPAFFSALLFVDIGCLSIVLVLRALLIGATGLQSELDEVI